MTGRERALADAIERRFRHGEVLATDSGGLLVLAFGSPGEADAREAVAGARDALRGSDLSVDDLLVIVSSR